MEKRRQIVDHDSAVESTSGLQVGIAGEDLVDTASVTAGVLQLYCL